jgi:competence protein ComEA
VLGYTRRQLVLLAVALGVAAGGLAVDRWRRAHPDLAAYLEALDRAAPPAREPAPRREAGTGVGRPRPADAPLDVNLATVADLERLPGVGPALAARIVDARARDGPFASVDDLRRVRGVGAATLERLRPRLAVNTP